MADRDYVFTATLDESEILAVLKNIDKNVEAIAGRLEKSFTDLETVAARSFKGVGESITKETNKATEGVKKVEDAVKDLSKAARNLQGDFKVPEPSGPDRIEQIRGRSAGPEIPSTPSPVTDKTYNSVKNFVAQYTSDLEALEQQSTNNIAEQLKLTAALNETDQEFIDNAAAMSRTSDEFIEMIESSGAFSSSQVKIAQSLALVEAGLNDTENATGSLTDRSQHLGQMRAILEGLADAETDYVSKLRRVVGETNIAAEVSEVLRDSLNDLNASFQKSFSLNEAREELDSLEELMIDVVGKERTAEVFNFDAARLNLDKVEEIVERIRTAESEGRLVDAQQARQDLLAIREEALASLDLEGQTNLISVKNARESIGRIEGALNDLLDRNEDIINPDDGVELVDRVNNLKQLLNQDYNVIDTDEAQQEVVQLRELITRLIDDEEIELEFGNSHIVALKQLINIDDAMNKIESRKIDLVDLDLLRDDIAKAQSLLGQLTSEDSEERRLFNFDTTLTQLEQVRKRLTDLVGEERAKDIIDFDELFDQLVKVENKFGGIFDNIPDAGKAFNFDRALNTLDKVEIQFKELLEGEEGDPLGLDESRVRLDDLQQRLQRLVSGDERADLFDFKESREELNYLEEQIVSLVGRDVADKIIDFGAARTQLDQIEAEVLNILAQSRSGEIFDLTEARAQLSRLREEADFGDLLEGQDIGSLLNFGGAINALDSYNDKAVRLNQINTETTDSVRGLATAQKELATASGKSASEQAVLAALTKQLQAEEADRQQGLVNLAAAELRAAVGSDKVANSYIQLAAAGSNTLGVFSDVLAQNNRITQSQVDLAAELAKVKSRIQSVTAQLNSQNLPEGRYEELQNELQGLIARYEDYNGRLRKTATAQKNAESELLRAVKIYPDVREEVEALTEEYGTFTVAIGTSEEQMTEAQKAFIKTLKTNESLAKELDRLQKEYGQFNAVVSKAAVTQSTYYNAGQRAERQFLRTLKTFPQVRKEVAALTDQYGTFRVQVGQAGEEQTEAQRAFMRAIDQDQRLRRELDRLNEEYGDFVVTVDRASVSQREFNKSLSGTRLGAVAGIFQELTRRIIRYGEEAVRAIYRILKESVGIAKQFEQTEAAFVGIFGQRNANIAIDTLARVRQESERLGVALEPILPRLFPRVQDFDQAIAVAELIPGLAASAPDLGPDDALRAINEALAGDYVSLRRAFEIPVGNIQRLGKELGLVDGLIEGLGQELEQMGLTFEQQEDTAYIAINRIQQSFVTLRSIIGEPILEGLKNGLTEISDVIDDNRAEIEFFVQQLGELFGTSLETLLGGAADIIDNLDFEKLTRDINDIENLIISFGNLKGAVGDVIDGFEILLGLIPGSDEAAEVGKVTKELKIMGRVIASQQLENKDLGFWDVVFPAGYSLRRVNLKQELAETLQNLRLYAGGVETGALVLSLALGDIDREEYDRRITEVAKETLGVVTETNDAIDENNAEYEEQNRLLRDQTDILSTNNRLIEMQRNNILRMNNLQKELNKLKTQGSVEIDESIIKSQERVFEAFGGLGEDLDFGTGAIEEITLFEDAFSTAISGLSSTITSTLAPEVKSALGELSGSLDEFDFVPPEIQQTIIPSFAQVQGDIVQLADEYILDNNELEGVIDPELLEAQAEINDEIAAFIQESKETQLEIIAEYNGKIYDLEVELSRKREEIARETAQKIKEAYKDFQDDLEDFRIKRGRDFADLAEKQAREETDIELEKQQKLIDAEEDFRNKLAEIRRKFDFDQREALRQNDAVAFLRLQRRREFELNEARIDYEQKRDDVIDEADKQRDELKKNLDREEKDLEKSLKRREEDLKRAYQRKLRDIIQAGQEELEELARIEEEKREEILFWLDQRQQDLVRNTEDKIRKIRLGLEEERTTVLTRLTEIQRLEQGILETRARQYELFVDRAIAAIGLLNEANLQALPPSYYMTDEQLASASQQSGGAAEEETEPPNQYTVTGDPGPSLGEYRIAARQAVADSNLLEIEKLSYIRWIGDTTQADIPRLIDLIEDLGGIVPRAKGGPFGAADTVLVGEKGPELVTFNRSGYVIPNHELMNFSATPARVINNIDRSKRAKVDLSMLDPNYLSNAQKAIIKQMIQETLLEVL